MDHFDSNESKSETSWPDDSELGHWELYPSSHDHHHSDMFHREKWINNDKNVKQEMFNDEPNNFQNDPLQFDDEDSRTILGFEMEDPGPSDWVNEDMNMSSNFEKSSSLSLNNKQQHHNDNEHGQTTTMIDSTMDGDDNELESQSARDRIKFLEENIKMEADEIERLESSSMGNFAQSPFNPDHEKFLKKLLIQRHLIILLHAQKCQSQRNHGDNGDQALEEDEKVMQCTLPLCRVAKNLMNHMRNCRHDKNCTDSHCFSSHLIVSHWNSCQNSDCFICSPLRKQLNFDLPRIPGPLTPYPNSNYPPSSSSPTTTTPSKSKSISVDHSYATPPSPSDQKEASSSSSTDHDDHHQSQEWHSTVSPDIRTHLVYKIVGTICPEFEPPPASGTTAASSYSRTGSTLDQRMVHRLVAYAKRLETKIFEAANSRIDYYDLLSDRLYWIQTERLDMRRRVRHECARRALKLETLEEEKEVF